MPGGSTLFEDESARIWTLDRPGLDDVVILSFKTKGGTIGPGLIAAIGTAIALAESDFKGLVLWSPGQLSDAPFSYGADLQAMLPVFMSGGIAAIGPEIAKLQDAMLALRYAQVPTVAAVAGMALGGGCEVLLHCDAVQAHAETYMGLVEVGVGLIPGWGGTTTMLKRWAANKKAPKGPMPAVAKAFEMISTAQVSKSAAEAQELLFLQSHDAITMNRDRLLADAKAKALSLVEGYKPPEPVTLKLPGAAGRAALAMAVDGFAAIGKATPHDVVVCHALAEILTGGPADPIEDTPEDKIYALERSVFMDLVRNPASLARVEHMLETGKPLRN